MIYAVILAGGKGERFWPLSRQVSPKQFLNVTGNLTLIQHTIKRILKIIPPERFYVVTNKLYAGEIKKQLGHLGINSANILFEPVSRNTGPAIAWVSKIIYEKDKNAEILILPSDHVVGNEDLFISLIKQGFKLAKSERIVIFGIKPRSAHEGYGYVKVNKSKKRSAHLLVDSFIEKPPLRFIKKIIKSDRYFWNCGIFIANVKFLIKQYSQISPEIFRIVKKINKNNLGEQWKMMPSISFDHAIMEKIYAKDVVMFDASEIGWSDVGSWSELRHHLVKDENNNIFRADSIDIGSQNTIVWGAKRLITTIGLKDLIIIDTDDALLVCNIDKSQEVKEIVRILDKKGRHEHIHHKKMKFITSKR